MSWMWMFGRSCEPPNTVISPLWTARLVRMLTTTSSRCRGEYPQTVAGRIVTVVKPGARSCSSSTSHSALNLE